MTPDIDETPDNVSEDVEFRYFEPAAVATAISGIMVCENFGDAHEFIEYICDRPIWSHQLPSIHRLIKKRGYDVWPWTKEAETAMGAGDAALTLGRKLNEQYERIPATKGSFSDIIRTALAEN